MLADLDERFREAVQAFWDARDRQQRKQIAAGKIDAGTRGAVTGGTQMGALEILLTDILINAGLPRSDIRARTALELPGYYRPEKRWDLLVVSGDQLVLAVELKSQVGPSFGNNFNNRTEEAIGNAEDIWTAYREGGPSKAREAPVRDELDDLDPGRLDHGDRVPGGIHHDLPQPRVRQRIGQASAPRPAEWRL